MPTDIDALLTKHFAERPWIRQSYLTNAHYHLYLQWLRRVLTVTDHEMQSAGIPGKARENLIAAIVSRVVGDPDEVRTEYTESQHAIPLMRWELP